MDDIFRDLPAFEPGSVWLAGAGPGEPGLLSLLALHGLKQADIVVYDALVDERILAMARPVAVREYAGKRGGKPSAKQRDISLRLIELAREGKRVLRLKGGDPFVFGRGGEEALALVAAGVSFRIVPGISAGIGGLAYAGIPVTHRDVNSAVTFVTGHDASGLVPDSVDWTALANGILTVVANASTVVGMWMLAHAFRAAGIELPGSRASRVAVQLFALALALGAAGPPAFIELRALLHGQVSHLANLASCIGDIVAFSLIAPMLMTAVALRGGLLSWPFALLTASLVSWLCFDATFTLAPLTGRSDADVKLMLEFFRALACTFGGGAGYAQRLVADAVGETLRR